MGKRSFHCNISISLKHQVAKKVLQELKDHPESWTQVDSILESSSNQNTKVNQHYTHVLYFFGSHLFLFSDCLSKLLVLHATFIGMHFFMCDLYLEVADVEVKQVLYMIYYARSCKILYYYL